MDHSHCPAHKTQVSCSRRMKKQKTDLELILKEKSDNPDVGFNIEDLKATRKYLQGLKGKYSYSEETDEDPQQRN